MLVLRALLLLLCASLPLSSGTASADEVRLSTVVEDPHYGEVLFHFYQEDYFPAIVRLLAAQQSARLPNHDAEAELLLGGLYLSYGHHRRAATIFERLLRDNTDPSVRDRTWFFLARIWQQRGYLDEAERALGNIETELPGSLAAERRLLRAQIAIDKGSHAQAIDLLDGYRDRTEWGSYARFNLGVALVRNGEIRAAEVILNELGQLNPHTEELAALRDKANLALGYAYLQDGRAHEARQPLQRVRLNGPFSNKALLGFGWAEAELDRYNSALVPWLELRDRDLLDPAVQEALLAIPFAMAKVNAVSQAESQYLDAIEALQQENARIERAIVALESGTFLNELLASNSDTANGWRWRLESLPDSNASHYLVHLLATHAFQEGLKNYRDLDYLARNLDDWSDNLDVFSNMLETREAAYAVRLPRVQHNLTRANIESLVDRKLGLDARLNIIERDGDALALASSSELALWQEIAALAAKPVLRSENPEVRDLQHKVRLLQGVLRWGIEKSFRERLWRLRRNLQLGGAALVETQRARRQIDEAMRNEPHTFAEFESRIAALHPRIRTLQAQVTSIMARQRAYLLSIATREMRAQQDRLQAYSVQARFALASIYDRSATAGPPP